MNKVYAVVAAIVMIGAASGWAQTTNVVSQQAIVLRGKLSPSGRTVTGADLAGNSNALAYLELQIVSGTTTSTAFAIGQSTGTGTAPAIFLMEKSRVNLVNSAKRSKFLDVFAGTAGSAMNATLLLSGTATTTISKKATNTTVTGTITGIWSDGTSSVQGTFTTSKTTVKPTPVHYAQVNGVTLGYQEFGSGDPLLMLPGFGATMNTQWNATFIRILASKYHVYTFDYRGMGLSGDNQATPSIPQYADDAAALMTALGYPSMHVYGVSMGATVAQQLVIDHPARVRKLVLDSVTYSIRIPATTNLLATIEAAAAAPSLSAGVHEEAQANLAWNGSWASLASIQKDVMLVVGTADVTTPESVAVQIAGQIDGSWLVRFKGLPHVGSHFAPVAYGENALDFLGIDESPSK